MKTPIRDIPIRRRPSTGVISLLVTGLLMIASAAVSSAQENPCTFSGYLWGTGAASSFEVYADTEDLTIVFTWSAGTADFWVRAMDRNRKEVLVDRSLGEGDVFTLSGKGIYYFEIYSKWGGGCWKASVEKNN
jgi:hypothetical protein